METSPFDGEALRLLLSDHDLWFNHEGRYLWFDHEGIFELTMKGGIFELTMKGEIFELTMKGGIFDLTMKGGIFVVFRLLIREEDRPANQPGGTDHWVPTLIFTGGNTYI